MRLSLQIFIVLVSVPCHAVLGQLLFSSVISLVSTESGREKFRELLERGQLFIPSYVFGLLLHLSFAFAALCLGLPWSVALLVPLLPGLLFPERAWRLVRSAFPRIGVNFVLWFLVSIVLGVSLFDANNGITTIWVNNYGDLTVHLGMISSFVFGDNFPPEYPIYAGEALSYPFFVNLWSALYWWIFPNWAGLSVVFAFQWVVVWVFVYYLLRGDTYYLAPWAVLFAGGAYMVFFWESGIIDPTVAVPHAHSQISKGYPWTPFLTTVWVTQRPILLGLLSGLASARLFHFYLESKGKDEGLPLLALAGLILSLMPLVHTHTLLVYTLYMFFTLSFQWLGSCLRKPGDENGPPTVKHLVLFVLSLSPGSFFIPFLWGKRGIVQFSSGWMPWELGEGLLNSFAGVGKMWLANAPFFLLFLFLLTQFTKRQAAALALLVLFVFGNLVSISVWPWDQLKVFLGIYVLVIAHWSTLQSKWAHRVHWLFIILLVPALYESFIVIKGYQNYTVYTADKMAQAESVRKLTKRDAIIAGAPDHHSPLTLTGRRMFSGYGGTLGSHNVEYLPRENILKKLDSLARCESLAEEAGFRSEYCPDYVLWTPREATFISGEIKGNRAFVATKLPYLYARQDK